MDGFYPLKTYIEIQLNQSGMFLFRTNGGKMYLDSFNAITGPAAMMEWLLMPLFAGYMRYW